MNLVAVRTVPSSVGTIEVGCAFHAEDDRGRELVASGHARLDDGKRVWDGIRWPGATVVILASGPSLTADQCAAVKAWREVLSQGMRRVIVINTTFRMAPWADVLYACDAPWWKAADQESARLGFKNYWEEATARFNGELWTQDEVAKRDFGVNRIESQRNAGLGKRPGVIHQGGNGGFQAINLAYQAGAKRLILLGFDMHGTHWHGKYTNGLPNTPAHLFGTWIKNFEALARDLKAEGLEVLNSTPGSALQCFDTADLEATLA